MAAQVLADDGWRKVVRSNAVDLATGLGFNTPSTGKVDALVERTTGIKKIASTWRWRHSANEATTRKLDQIIRFRGGIVLSAIT